MGSALWDISRYSNPSHNFHDSHDVTMKSLLDYHKLLSELTKRVKTQLSGGMMVWLETLPSCPQYNGPLFDDGVKDNKAVKSYVQCQMLSKYIPLANEVAKLTLRKTPYKVNHTCLLCVAEQIKWLW